VFLDQLGRLDDILIADPACDLAALKRGMQQQQVTSLAHPGFHQLLIHRIAGFLLEQIGHMRPADARDKAEASCPNPQSRRNTSCRFYDKIKKKRRNL